MPVFPTPWSILADNPILEAILVFCLFILAILTLLTLLHAWLTR